MGLFSQKKAIALFSLLVFLVVSVAVATVISTPFGTISFQLEGFENLETIYKQPGDLVKINLVSSTEQEILFNAPEEFALLAGPCVPDTSGKIQLQTGNNTCTFAIEERTQGNFNIIAENATKKITVIASPETLYVTNSIKLKQRYNNDAEVNALLLSAYNKANEDTQSPGIVYDLAQFDNLEHPFTTYPYDRNPTNPSNYQPANDYVVQAAQLIREKCGNCKNIVLIGDDFVIPHFVVDYPEWQTTYGNFLGTNVGTVQTNYLYTDQPFIPTTKMTFSNMGTLFSHETISFVLPSPLINSPAVNELKNALRTTFEATILQDIDAASIQCNNAPLAAKTSNLIVIGNKNDNPATKCFPWVDETSQTISLERNVWNDNTTGTKYAIVINSSDSSTLQGLAILISNNMLGNYQTTMIEKIDLLLNELSFIPDLPGDIAQIVHDCGHIGASWINHHEDDEGHGIWCIADIGFVLLPIASSKYAKIAAGADDLAVARFGKKALQAKKMLKEAGYTDEIIDLTMRGMGKKAISKGGTKLGLINDLVKAIQKDPTIIERADNEKLVRLIRRTGFELEDGTKYTLNAKILENSIEEIPNSIIVKQGTDAYSATHFLNEHRQDFIKTFGALTDEQIIDIAEEVGQTSTKATKTIDQYGRAGLIFKKQVTRFNSTVGENVTREVWVRVSDEPAKKGWVITSHPT